MPLVSKGARHFPKAGNLKRGRGTLTSPGSMQAQQLLPLASSPHPRGFVYFRNPLVTSPGLPQICSLLNQIKFVQVLENTGKLQKPTSAILRSFGPDILVYFCFRAFISNKNNFQPDKSYLITYIYQCKGSSKISNGF